MKIRSLETSYEPVLNGPKICLLLLFTIAGTCIIAQQKIIQLYDGVAPGSESWNWEEKTFFVKTPLNANVVYNVSKPTLTVFTPDSANGTAVIVCPGGALRVVNFETEGKLVAEYLIKKGITVFVLKYRVAQSFTDDPWKEMEDALRNRTSNPKEMAAIRIMATEDLKAAMNYVRQHASTYNIDLKKIGLMGFSGGGGLVRKLACNYTAETRPAFIASMYSGPAPDSTLTIPADAPPLFIAAASDDTRLPVSYNIRLYNAWIASKHSAEMHIYSKGEHGLRGSKTSQDWIIRFKEWLTEQGF